MYSYSFFNNEDKLMFIAVKGVDDINNNQLKKTGPDLWCQCTVFCPLPVLSQGQVHWKLKELNSFTGEKLSWGCLPKEHLSTYALHPWAGCLKVVSSRCKCLKPVPEL